MGWTNSMLLLKLHNKERLIGHKDASSTSPVVVLWRFLSGWLHLWSINRTLHPTKLKSDAKEGLHQKECEHYWMKKVWNTPFYTIILLFAIIGLAELRSILVTELVSAIHSMRTHKGHWCHTQIIRLIFLFSKKWKEHFYFRFPAVHASWVHVTSWVQRWTPWQHGDVKQYTHVAGGCWSKGCTYVALRGYASFAELWSTEKRQ